jgi:hypothetical protein
MSFVLLSYNKIRGLYFHIPTPIHKTCRHVLTRRRRLMSENIFLPTSWLKEVKFNIIDNENI